MVDNQGTFTINLITVLRYLKSYVRIALHMLKTYLRNVQVLFISIKVLTDSPNESVIEVDRCA